MNIPFFKNYWSSKDIACVTKVIKRGMHWANGPEIVEFENQLAKISGSKYAVAFNSGTSALFGILAVLNIKGKEVIVPSFTFIATANAVLHAGGTPVFADIDPQTMALLPEDVERKITPKTVAIMPVHYGGMPAQINQYKKIAQKYKLDLVEDAAESLGARFNGKPVGGFGIAGMFSFTPTKVISTGEGGVIVTNSKVIYEELKLFRSHGRLETENYFTTINYLDYIKLGYGMRMPTIVAAQGLAQLSYLDKIIKRRQEIAAFYTKHLSAIDQIMLPNNFSQAESVFQMYTIRVHKGRSLRDRLQKHLYANKIETKVYFEPVHKSMFYKKILGNSPNLPKTEELAGQVLSLPIYPGMKKSEILYVIRSIKQFFDQV